MDSTGLLSRYGNKVSGNSQYNFVTNVRSSKWKVNNQNLTTFFLDYCNKLREILSSYECPEVSDSHEVQRSVCNIMQKSQPEIAVVYDLHLDYTSDITNPLPPAFLYWLIVSVQQAISEVYTLSSDDDDPKELTCVLLGWPQPIIIRDSRPGHLSEDCIRYRYFLHFPECRVEANTLVRLTKRVYSNLRTNNAMGTLQQTPVGDWDAILKPIINDALPLYGSSEKTDYPPALYMNTYGDLGTISMDSFDADVGLDLEVLNVLDHNLVKKGIINIDDLLGGGEDFTGEDLLPVILYGCYSGTICSLRESILDEEGTPVPNVATSAEGFLNNPEMFQEKTNEDILIELLPLVAPHRYSNRMTFLTVGKAIYTTYKGSEEGLSVWIGSTEKAVERMNSTPLYLEDKSVNEICTEYYNTFGDRIHITFKTIVWYAMEDNPGSYSQWHTEWSQNYLKKALTLQEDEIAKAIYCDLWLTYAVPGNGCKSIFRFRDHRWSRVDGGYTIRVYITDEFKKRYEYVRANLYRMIADSRDETFRERLEATAARVSKLIDKLGKHSTKSKLVNELMDRLVVEELGDYMDANGELTGLPNGVAEVDTDLHTIIVRPGKPEDYLSRTTLVRLNEKYNWSHPLVKEFTDWMKKMFPNEDTREFVYKFLASLWLAGNPDKILLNFSGEAGNNGKSTFGRAIMKAWGSYGVKFPTTGLTRGYSDSGSANPAWVRLSGPRIAQADETDEGEYYRSGPTKLVSGNDDFYGRKLYSDGGDLQATATVAVFSNRVAPFRGADDAVRKRFYIVPCLSQWRDKDVPETEEEQFEARVFKNDPDFIRKVVHLSPALLWVSFQYFPKWSRDRLHFKPAEVQEATNAYWSENDVYRMFTSDQIVEGNENDTLTVTQVYEDFESWFLRYNKNQQPPDRATMRYHLTQLWGTTTDGKWYGIRLNQFEQNDMIANIANAMKKARSTPKKAEVPSKMVKETKKGSPKKLTETVNLLRKVETIGEDKAALLGKEKERPSLSTMV